MGHAEELEQFVRAIKGEPNHLLSWEGSSLATLCMFAAQESIRLGAEIDLDQFHRSLLAPADDAALQATAREGSARSAGRTRRDQLSERGAGRAVGEPGVWRACAPPAAGGAGAGPRAPPRRHR